MKKTTKIAVIVVSVLAILAVLIIVFISPITKYAVEIEDIVLDKPIVTVIQSKKKFNFNDLIELFSTPENADTPSVSKGFTIPRIKINDGIFRYRENVIPIDYSIKKVNFETTEKRLNVDSL